jgi:hypothetical protein
MGELKHDVYNGWGDAWAYRGWLMEGIDPSYGINNTFYTTSVPDTSPELASWSYAGSYHDGGALFLLGDGSVRFISENIDSTTLYRLCTYVGAEIIGEF